MELIEANWPLLLVALLIGLALAFFLFKANRRTRVTGESGDVLDEGASPAARNQALIDSGGVAATPPATPPATPAPPRPSSPEIQPAERFEAPQPVVPPTPAGLAGAGVAVASGATQPVGDDLTRIKGVGPKLAARLGELGVTGFAQISAWDEAAIDRIDAELGRFQGRIRRDDWVEQARLLAVGNTAEYQTRFGRLD